MILLLPTCIWIKWFVKILFSSLALLQLCLHCWEFHFLLEGAAIGLVEPELYALAAGVVGLTSFHSEKSINVPTLEQWMKDYANVLCLNSWQVKQYVDVYSSASVDGFSTDDMRHINNKYDQAQQGWQQIVEILQQQKKGSHHMSVSALKGQIKAYSKFLDGVAELARSKWTEFNMNLMSGGLGVMFYSLVIHLLFIKKTSLYKEFSLVGASQISLGSVFAVVAVVIRGGSFLSNSYILEEGKVSIFLLATSGILHLRYSVKKSMMLAEASILLILALALRIFIEIGLSKQAVTSLFMSYQPSWFSWLISVNPLGTLLSAYVPILALRFTVYLINKIDFGCNRWRAQYLVIKMSILSYMLLVVHFALENNLINMPSACEYYKRVVIPRTVYAVGLGNLLLLACGSFRHNEKVLDSHTCLYSKAVCMFCTWSPTIILLSGSNGSYYALLSIIGGTCIKRLQIVEEDSMGSYSVSAVTQWAFLAVCLFFATGHWCAFDGLRYGAAFIGFDEFVLLRQGVFLAIETFGFSHILPILGLPFLIADGKLAHISGGRPSLLFVKLSLVYLIYGMISAITITFTMLCVTIHRRHLMVWGLFAPKFVFDVVGLLLTDALICMASVYYVSTGN